MVELIFDEKLLSEAKALGATDIILALPLDKLPKEKPKSKEGIKIAVIITDRKHIAKARNKADLLIGPATREFFEDKRIDMIIGLGLEPRKDHTHFRRSLTQVEVMLAKQQGKTILYSFADLLASRRPAELLGRWAQDLRIIKKKKPHYALVSGARSWDGLRSQKDREHFLHVVEKI